MNMLRGDVLFSLQIIMLFRDKHTPPACGPAPPPAVSVETAVQGLLNLGQAQGEKEERVCQRAQEWSGQHRLAAAN